MNSRKMILTGLAVAFLAFAIPGISSAANILVNPGFETGDLTGWQVFGVSPSSNATVQSGDNGPSAPGDYNTFLDNQAQALALVLKQSTAVGTAGPGTVYYSFDLKLDQADLGGVLFVQIFAEQEGIGVIGGTGLMGPYWPWGAWTNFNGSFEAPAGTDFLTIQFEAVTGATVGSNCRAHVDNVSLDQGTTAVEATSWGGIKSMYR
ncbi:MAG: hypothetical protein JW958_12095 [Candidatus Eisenbacteria bacterium]|nr:hypothetical protein [Candidatus Eisenbacteria bacterium]